MERTLEVFPSIITNDKVYQVKNVVNVQPRFGVTAGHQCGQVEGKQLCRKNLTMQRMCRSNTTVLANHWHYIYETPFLLLMLYNIEHTGVSLHVVCLGRVIRNLPYKIDSLTRLINNEKYEVISRLTLCLF